MIPDVINALANFDFGFLLQLALDNLFWVFALYAAGYYFSDSKKPLATGIFAFLIIFCTIEILNKLIGFSMYTAYALFLIYFGRLAVLTVLQNSNYKQLIPTAYVFVFFIVFAWVALGM